MQESKNKKSWWYLPKHGSNPLHESSKTRKWTQPDDGILWHEISLTMHPEIMGTMTNEDKGQHQQQEQQTTTSTSSTFTISTITSLNFQSGLGPPLSLTSSSTWTKMLFINKSSTTNNKQAKKLLTPWRQPRKSPLERSPSLGDGHGLGQRFLKVLRKHARRRSSRKKRLIRRRRWNGKRNNQPFK